MLHNKNSTQRMVLTALFGALVCVATLVIMIPSPLGGYINLGDTVVLLCGFALGGWYGVTAAGVGSMLADFIAGYIVYLPATLLIKSLMSAVAGVLYQVIRRGERSRTVKAAVFAGVAAEAVMVAGYYLFALVFLKEGGAAALTIPGNALQGLAGIVGSTALLLGLERTGLVK